jgi:F420-0:gamma-glutamyl ligase
MSGKPPVSFFQTKNGAFPLKFYLKSGVKRPVTQQLDYRGKPDIFGRKLKFSRTDVADSLASAAVVLMGEGNEQQPLAIIEKYPAEFCEKVDSNELRISMKEDMYGPIFQKFSKR